ncbi:MAG: ribonuclease HII [Gammaproteobacteria bacterium]|nr:MAG: ribonuclease HII [Gammaproteobacteria bacterium]
MSRAQLLAAGAAQGNFGFAAPHGLVAGVDEAGRGPLAGPVYAAAVILNPAQPIAGLADSKTLDAATRARLDAEIRARALAWATGSASVQEIDQLNILRATLLAMQRAVAGLRVAPRYVLVDGNQCPALSFPVVSVIKGDARYASISAASILAKVARDRVMAELDRSYPGYGFAEHKGYGTAQHLHALRNLGVTPEHRCSFAPVRDCMTGAAHGRASVAGGSLLHVPAPAALGRPARNRMPGTTGRT